MAGTSWDKLGQMEQAFELVAPALRRVAEFSGLQLREFFRDDPVWRLQKGDSSLDVSWDESRPEEYVVSALWWEGESLHREDVGVYTRDRSLEELEGLLREALARLPE